MMRASDLNIAVCVKSVVLESPKDADAKILRTPENSGLNPFDRPALETALRLREEHGGSVSVLSMGPEVAQEALYECLAMGADRATLLCDPALAGSDTLATSNALAAALKTLGHLDLVLFGARTADSDTGQVGPQTAPLLGMPVLTSTWSLTAEDGAWKAERRADGFREVYGISLPAALIIHPASLTPRDVSLPGLSRAFQEGEVELWSLADVGLAAARTGEQGSATVVVNMRRVERKRECEHIRGPVEKQAEELVAKLSREGLLE